MQIPPLGQVQGSDFVANEVLSSLSHSLAQHKRRGSAVNHGAEVGAESQKLPSL